MSRFGGGLREPLSGASPAVGAGGVEIPSNLLISSGCLSLSGLNLTSACGGGGGGGGGSLRRAGPRPLVGLGGLHSWGPMGLVLVAGGGLGAGIGGGLG